MGRSNFVGVLLAVAVAACGHEVNGSTLLLNMQPTPPTFAGAYDFDLLGIVQGQACIPRDSITTYLVAGPAFDKMPDDGLASQAIAAAVFSIVEKTTNADSFVVTRALIEARGTDKTCATVWGHGIRLRKARGPAAVETDTVPLTEVKPYPKKAEPEE